MLRNISRSRLNKEAASIAAGMGGGFAGSLLIWFASVANTFPHSLGGFGVALAVIVIVFAFAYAALDSTVGWTTAGVALVYLVLLIIAMSCSFDDKLLHWNVSATWIAVILLMMMALGELLYRALCYNEDPSGRERWLFVIRSSVGMLIVTLMLGLLAGILGIQTMPPG